ncbi:RdRP-domain-containing protein [Biscogniauxia marginata]|nr:RdRP-domain-containing protein [Biscogniauxia marginata]
MDSKNLGASPSHLLGHGSTSVPAHPENTKNSDIKTEPTTLSSRPRRAGFQSSSSNNAASSQSNGDEDHSDRSWQRPNSHQLLISHDVEEGVIPNMNGNIKTTSNHRSIGLNGRHPAVSNGHRSRKPQHGSYHIGLRPDWSDWEELSVRIKKLPAQTRTFDLWRHFETFGNIVYIDISEDEHAARTGTALVRFSPPPSQPFWRDSVVKINIKNEKFPVHVTLLSRLPPRNVRSPRGIEYPRRLSLIPARLQFGVLVSENKFMAMRTVPTNLRSDFSLAIDLKTKRLEVRFACDLKDPRREDPSIKHPSAVGVMEGISEYKIYFLFAHLKKLVFVNEDEGFWSLIAPLPSPPVLFKKYDSGKSHSTNRSSWSESDTWSRAVDIMYDSSWLKTETTSLQRNYQYIDIGRWTTYKLTFKNSALAIWDTMKSALQDFNIETIITDKRYFPTVPAESSSIWNILEPLVDSKAPNANLALLAGTEEVHLPYDVRYQLEVCISQGFLNEVNIDIEFLRKLANLSKDRNGRRDRAKDLLTYISEFKMRALRNGPKKIYEKRIYEPMAVFNDREARCYYPAIGLPEHCVWIRKVVVTPSTIHLNTPTPEPSNRVLRNYTSYIDRFLRVQFTDELVKGRIFPSPDSEENNALFNRVFRTLSNGIRIGDRHFKFLACGNSQFRENGAYFFSETDDLTCDQIRSWMGEVNHIKIVAKYAARLGQCFSTTRTPKGIPIGQSISAIPDIEHNGWCFSDGVGKISATLAEYIARHLRLGKRNVPSAFQFRLGGHKGLLVAWPGLPFNNIKLRPSQDKFNSVSKGIEIIKASQFSVATLNRQTISILSSLGVPDAAFVDMLKDQLKNYDLAMDDPQIAMKLLNKYVDENGITTMIAQMILDGFMQTKEPFFVAVLQVWRAWSLRLLKEKARIVVDKGAFVFGCVDETFTLRGYHKPTKSRSSTGEDPKYPQIFLQVPKSSATPGDAEDLSDYTVVTGLCVVGRNPSLHPGDIRVVEAVDVPDLRHIRDVVVFPATGDRDIPSMCSGGDLDGDDFFVIWDPKLIPTEHHYAPMIHEPPQPNEIDRDVRTSDLIQFFVTYIKNDSLSTIAHAHLARSDALKEGPKDPICVELAHLHSNAVDYPKSGQPAHLKRSLRPKMWPHFMEKAGRTYHSKKVLGQLYDLTNKVDFTPKYDGPFDERILRRYKLSADMLKNARILKREHDKALRQIMNQREIGTEFEVWTTFVMTRPRVGSDYKMQETMGAVVASHKERFRDACIKVAGSREHDVLYPMAAAAYRVTWEEVQVAIKETQQEISLGGRIVTRRRATADAMPLISFPWIFDIELGRIAKMDGDLELEAMPEPTINWHENEEDNDGEDEDEFERLVGPLNHRSLDGDQKGSGDEDGDKKAEAEAEEEEEAGSATQEEMVEIEDIETGMEALGRLAD